MTVAAQRLEVDLVTDDGGVVLTASWVKSATDCTVTFPHKVVVLKGAEIRALIGDLQALVKQAGW